MKHRLAGLGVCWTAIAFAPAVFAQSTDAPSAPAGYQPPVVRIPIGPRPPGSSATPSTTPPAVPPPAQPAPSQAAPAQPTEVAPTPSAPAGPAAPAATSTTSPTSTAPAQPSPAAVATPATSAVSTVAPAAAPAVAPPPAPVTAVEPIAVPRAAPALPPPPPGVVAPESEPETQLVRRPSLMRERLHLLNAALPPMAARSRDGRITDGLISLAIGAGTIVVPFLLPVPTAGAQDVRPWLWTFGGVTVAYGILTLAWVPARERLAWQFDRMPMETAAQRRARVLFGEHALEEIASEGNVRRTLGAVGNIGLSLAMLGAIYWDPIFNGTPHTLDAYDALILSVTGVSVIMSVIQLFGRSEEQQMLDAYRNQVRLLREERGGSDR